MTEAELEAIIEKAIGRALRDVGILATDDRSLEKRRRDFAFLHDLRLAKESVVGKVVAAAITVVVGGFCVLLVAGFRGWSKLN
ncbi:MAG: hypothetical protein K2Y29_16395 [Beijerinckiaceae bacterium]|nr:hypothetical protein [Beijerinckiaceae bacterium]